jgi:hypothetical protein
MLWEEIEPTLKSNYRKNNNLLNSTTNDCIFPKNGLIARNMLTSDQFGKLTEIRKRKLTCPGQWENFIRD